MTAVPQPSPPLPVLPRLVLEERGPADAPPVLLIHGICASARYWSERLGTLEQAWRCVMPDLLGHGRSPKPEHLTYDLASQADALEPVLAALVGQAGRPVPVIAHSMGNLVALELRRRHPDWLGPHWGMGVPYYPSREAGVRTLLELNPWSHLTIHRPWYASPLLHTARLSRGRLGYPWFHRQYGLPRDCWEDGFLVTWTSLVRTIHNLVLATDLPTLLREAAPHEFVWWHGSHDRSAPYEYIKPFWAAHPELETECIKGGTHNVWIFQHGYLLQELERRLQNYYS